MNYLCLTETEKKLKDFFVSIVEAINMSSGMSKLVTALGGVLLALALFFYIKHFVNDGLRSAGIDETGSPPGHMNNMPRILAALALALGICLSVLGPYLGSDAVFMTGTLLLLVAIISILLISELMPWLERRRSEPAGEKISPESDDSYPDSSLWSLWLGLPLVIVGLVAYNHAENVERTRDAAAARIVNDSRPNPRKYVDAAGTPSRKTREDAFEFFEKRLAHQQGKNHSQPNTPEPLEVKPAQPDKNLPQK